MSSARGKLLLDTMRRGATAWDANLWPVSAITSGSSLDAVTPRLVQGIGGASTNTPGTTTCVVTFTTEPKPQVGDLVIVRGARDNATSDPLTGDSLADTDGNTYTRVVAGSNLGTAGTGLVSVLFYSVLTVAWAAGTNTITWTTPGVTAHAMWVDHWTGVAGLRASGSGTGVSTTAVPTVTNTTPVAGDLVIGAAGFEQSNANAITGDLDTVNGWWQVVGSTVASAGSLAAAVKSYGAAKIVTAAGSQTWNPTNATACDSVAIIAVFTPVSGGNAYGRVNVDTPAGAYGDIVTVASKAVLPPDIEMLASFATADSLEHFPSFSWRATQAFSASNTQRPNDGYWREYTATSGVTTLYQMVAGASVQLGATGALGSGMNSKVVWLRVVCEGPSIKVRTWYDTAAEPAAWTHLATDWAHVHTGCRAVQVDFQGGSVATAHTVAIYTLKVWALAPGHKRKAGVRR